MFRAPGAPVADQGDTDDDRRWRRPESTLDTTTGAVSIVMLAVQGIVLDEARAFRSVLACWPGATWLTVGLRRGRVSGVGGAVEVDTELDEVGHCDLLVVPGSIGSETAGSDPRVGGWVASRARSAHWVLASSTGTLLLARAGVPLGATAATHWLASERLATYGVATCGQPFTQHRHVITSTGWLGARHATLQLTERIHGTDEAKRIAATAMTSMPAPASHRRHPWWCRGRRTRAGRAGRQVT